MRKSKKPTQPNAMNGDHEALWNFILRIDSRIDQLFLAFAAQALVLLGLGIILTILVVGG